MKIKLDGYIFDSPDEAKRYEILKELEISGKISGLRIHPVYELLPAQEDINLDPVFKNGKIRPLTFTPDFKYTETETGEQFIEDVKGKITVKNRRYTLKADWVIRLKLFKYIYPYINCKIFFFHKYSSKEKKLDFIRWGVC